MLNRYLSKLAGWTISTDRRQLCGCRRSHKKARYRGRERERETKKQRTVLHAGLILNVACGNADSYTDGDCGASGHGGAGTNNRTDESLIYNDA